MSFDLIDFSNKNCIIIFLKFLAFVCIIFEKEGRKRKRKKTGKHMYFQG